LDTVFLQSHLKGIIRELKASDIRVSLFVDPTLEQVKMAARLEADAVELNTGTYADLPYGTDPTPELARIKESSRLAARLDLQVLAGHGLNTRNVGPIAAIPEMEELNIGHSIIGRAVLVGLPIAVQEMLSAMAGKTS
jgi:pyridoxine 5-phosphate synthase